MIYRSLLPALLTLAGIGVTGCGNEATQPNPPADRVPTAPQLVVAPNTWTTRANMPGPVRYDLAAATVTNAAGQSIVYAIGGHTARHGGIPLATVMAYNAVTNTWATKAPMPAPLFGMNQAAVLNGKIFITGGCQEDALTCTLQSPSSALYVYNPATNTWAAKRGMPTVRTPSGTEQFGGTHGTAGVIAGKLYVLTECYEEVEPAFPHCSPALFFRYDPDTDRWTVLPRPAGGHDFAVGGVIQGKFYATTARAGEPLEVYDPATNRWTTRAPLPGDAIVRFATGAVMLQQLFVIGGERFTGTGVITLRRNIVYHPSTNTWTTKAPMPTARAAVAATKIFLNGQPRIEVVGGALPGNNLQYVP